jgi:hypothetical protein
MTLSTSLASHLEPLLRVTDSALMTVLLLLCVIVVTVVAVAMLAYVMAKVSRWLTAGDGRRHEPSGALSEELG